MHVLGHIPPRASRQLQAFDPDAVIGKPAQMAGHRRADGRPADRPRRPGGMRAGEAGGRNPMGDLFGVLITALLCWPTRFFVGAEFALISARRDRLEALAEQGKASAVAVIRAGERLSMMLAGAQLGITVCSIVLGRVGEPAVAHLLEMPFDLLGVPAAVLHTVSFFVAIPRGDPPRAARERWFRKTLPQPDREGGDARAAVPGLGTGDPGR